MSDITIPYTFFTTRNTRSLFFVAMTAVIVALLLALPSLALAASSGNWIIVASPNPRTKPISNDTFYGVAALSDSDVWAVGACNGNNAINHTLTEHWNGTAWSIVPSPDAGAMGSSLAAVSAVSSTDVWAVGAEQTSNSASGNRTLIEHWNGAAWSVVPSPDPSVQGDNLTGVVALSATDAWATGWYENNGQSALLPIILHWNGTDWSLFPNIPGISMIVRGIAAHSASDIWIVGYDPLSTTNISLHFNGTQWSVAPTAEFPSSFQQIWGVTVPAANDAWMVGSYSPNINSDLQPLAIHWNGTTWSKVATPDPNQYDNRLYAVAAINANDVWAVGQENTSNGLNLHTLIEHWNGTTWSIVASPNQPAHGTAFDVLLGVTTSGLTSLWSVGGFDHLVKGNPGERTLTLHDTQG